MTNERIRTTVVVAIEDDNKKPINEGDTIYYEQNNKSYVAKFCGLGNRNYMKLENMSGEPYNLNSNAVTKLLVCKVEM